MWHRLDPSLYAGPVVKARVHHPSAHLRATGHPPFVECWALLDTGATHSAIDPESIADTLGLATVDRRRMVLAEHGPTDVDVTEARIHFPDFDLPERRVRVSRMALPGPFLLLVGMDLLDGTRLELDVRGADRWLRWTSVG